MRTSSSAVRTLQALRKRSLVSSFNFSTSYKLFPHRGFMTSSKNLPSKQINFLAQPFPEEKKENFKVRVRDIANKLAAFPNHLVLMSYPTRIAAQDETLQNASKIFGTDKLRTVNISYNEQYLTPGHCLLAFIDEAGKVVNDYTFSLRPDMNKPALYKSKTANDTRLPHQLTNQETTVRPAKHTSFLQEIEIWAETAFYAHYVHRKRPTYPLSCLFKPMDSKNKNHYFESVKELKLICDRYSLLDHLHPHTGNSSGQIVSGQNCTVISRLFEKLMSIDMKKILGDNPTPQLVKKIINDFYFQMENVEVSAEDEFARPYIRTSIK